MNKVNSLGGWAAFICGIHCMAMPVLVAILPLAGLGFLMSEWLEVLLLASATGLSTLSLCWGFRQHRKLHPVWFLVAGIAWFAIGHFYMHSVWYSLAGGACFLISTIINRRLCRTCQHCSH